MSVRKIRNSWWVDFRVEGVRYRKKSPDNSRKGAQAYELLLRQRLARGQPLHGPRNPSARTFRDFAQEWFASATAGLKPSTRLRIQQTLARDLLPRFGSRRLDAIDEKAVEEYTAAQLGSGLTPQTVNTRLSILRTCLRAALEQGVLARCPRISRLLAGPLTRQIYLAVPEAEKLLSRRDEPLWWEAILMALHTGMRRGELLALDFADVHLDAPIASLTVRQNFSAGVLTTPKSGHSREIPLTVEVGAVLAARARPYGFVFARPDGKPYCPSAADYALRRQCRRTGVRPIGWHVLRHSFSSFLGQAGAYPKAMQDLMGHARPDETMKYTHLASLVPAVQLLPRFDLPKGGHPVGNVASALPPSQEPNHANSRSTEPTIAPASIPA